MKKLVTLLLSLALLTTTFAQNCDPTLYSFSMGYIKMKFKRSVFRIESGQNNGTGFLIDLNNGFLLTANHVIDDTSDIRLSNPFINQGATIKAKFVKNLKHKDICLLRLENVNSLSAYKDYITEFDISLAGLSPDQRYFSISLPTKNYTYDVNVMESRLKSVVTSDYVEVYYNAQDGMSGSPLIDERGYVVAFTKAKNFDQVSGYCTTFTECLPILQPVAVRKDTRQYMQSLEKGPVDIQRLLYFIDADPWSKTIRNIEIINMVASIKPGAKSKYDSCLNQYKSCITKMLANRGLIDLLPSISVYAYNPVTIPGLLELGASTKNSYVRQSLFALAESESIKSFAKTNSISAENVKASLPQLASGKSVAKVSRGDREFKESLANMLTQLSLIQFYLADSSKQGNDKGVEYASTALKLSQGDSTKYMGNLILWKTFEKTKNSKSAKKSKSDLLFLENGVANLPKDARLVQLIKDSSS